MTTPELAGLIGRIWHEGAGAVVERSSGRRPGDRARYATDPHGYARDILGATLTDQQEGLLELISTTRRAIVRSATNVGKTEVLAIEALWTLDAVAAVPDASGREQGAIVLLLGPTYDLVRQTIYARMLTLAARAAERGHPLPGNPSQNSVLWSIRPDWLVAVRTPPKGVGEVVSHSASGFHHVVMLALGEEAAGIHQTTLGAIEGGWSAPGNRIHVVYNPLGKLDELRRREESGGYAVQTLSALDHPNIRQRRAVVEAAVSIEEVERRIRGECRDMGAYPEHRPDPDHREFVYALPPEDGDLSLCRDDGHPGHRDGEPRVYRPEGPYFAPQVLGVPAAEDSYGLFDPAAWDRAVARWRAGQDPVRSPDRVGVDCGGGGDPTMAVPCWGSSARELYRLWRDVQHAASGARSLERREERLADLEERLENAVDNANVDYWRDVARRQREGLAVEDAERATEPATAADRETRALEGLRKTRRVRLGVPRRAPAGDGAAVARWLWQTWQDSPFVADRDGGDARYITGHLSTALGARVTGVSFGSSPLPFLPTEKPTDTRRAQMYAYLAWLVRQELVDLPPDPELREECLALQWVPRETWLTVAGQRVQVSGLTPKEDIRRALGRSPDKADAAALAVSPVAKGVEF